VTDPAANALSTHLEPAKRELAALVETNLITAEQQRTLSIATTNLAKMKSVSSPAAARRFSKIDTMIAVRGNSPVAQARECLAGLGAEWEGLTGEFHKFRKMHLEAKLLRAKLNKKAKAVTDITDDDDRAIAEAEIAVEDAAAAELEALVARGAQALQERIGKATKQSERYALICKQAGKEEFTDADFRAEEVDYYLKTAFWHAAQIYEAVDTRSKWMRDYGGDGSKVGPPPDDLGRDDMMEYEGKQRREAKKHMRIMIKSEALLYFQAMGITEEDVKGQIRRLFEVREGFDMSTAPLDQGRDFTPYFESWLANAVAVHRSRAMSAIDAGGVDRLKRIGDLLDPGEKDGGGRGTMKNMDRGSNIQ
jgi:hypothetical protein